MSIRYKSFIAILLVGQCLFGQKLSDKLFSPIKLISDSTFVVLEDFFPQVKQTAYRVTDVPEGLDLRIYDTYNFILYGKPKNKVDYLGISIHNSKFAIPIFKWTENELNIEQENQEKNYLTSTDYFANSKILELKSERKLSLMALVGNKLIEQENIKIQLKNDTYVYEITIPAYVSRISRIDLQIFGFNENGFSNDIYIPLTFGKPIKNHRSILRSDFHGNIIYNILIDRFYNGEIWNDQSISSPNLLMENNWQGGDFTGIKQKIIDDCFTNLGVNSLKISPILKSFNGIQKTDNQVEFSAYHGHWITSFTEIEPRFGTNEDLIDLIGQAHFRDMNIFMDFPVNYIHNEHFINQNNQSWTKNLEFFRDNNLHQSILSNEFLKALDLENKNVSQAISDSVLYWYRKFKIDGMAFQSIDQVPDSFLRKLDFKLKNKISIPQNRAFYQSVENLTHNKFNTETDILDAEYDYKLSNEISKAFIIDDYPFKDLKNETLQNLYNFGFHNLIPISIEAINDGNNKSDKNIKHLKILQLLAYNLSMPGIPVIKQGNEIGRLGKKDFLSDKIMDFRNLTLSQSQLKKKVSKLIKLRRKRMELMYGDARFLKTTDKELVVMRNYLNQTSFILFNKSNQQKTIEVKIPKLIKFKHLFAEFGSEFMTDNNELICILPAHGFEIIASQ